MNIETPHNSYADILQRLVRRYLFKLERQKEEGETNGAKLTYLFIFLMHAGLFPPFLLYFKRRLNRVTIEFINLF